VQGEGAQGSAVSLLSVSDMRTVMGRLGWQSSLDQVDPAQVCDGLSDAAISAVTESLAVAGDLSSLKALIKERSGA